MATEIMEHLDHPPDKEGRQASSNRQGDRKDSNTKASDESQPIESLSLLPLQDSQATLPRHRKGFFDLPAELRIKIYKMCFKWKIEFGLNTREPCDTKVFAALRLCRQIYHEAEAEFLKSQFHLNFRSFGKHKLAPENFLKRVELLTIRITLETPACRKIFNAKRHVLDDFMFPSLNALKSGHSLRRLNIIMDACLCRNGQKIVPRNIDYERTLSRFTGLHNIPRVTIRHHLWKTTKGIERIKKKYLRSMQGSEAD